MSQLRPAPHDGLQASALAAEGNQLVVATATAMQAQEAVGQDAAFEEGVELVFNKLRQAGPGCPPPDARIKRAIKRAQVAMSLRV